VRIVSRAPVFLVSAKQLDAWAAQLREAVAEFHRTKPMEEGISAKDLRARLGKRAGSEMFAAALTQLTAAGEISVTGDLVKRAGRKVELNSEEMRMRKGIEDAFAQSGLVPPAPAELFAKLGFEAKRAQNVFQLLLREKILVKVSEGIVLHAGAMDVLRKTLAKRKTEHGARLSIATFKELTGGSRKYAIPLLEYLDRNGVTRRDGDERIII
jgi:selenocysteine-specific elongation factor